MKEDQKRRKEAKCFLNCLEKTVSKSLISRWRIPKPTFILTIFTTIVRSFSFCAARQIITLTGNSFAPHLHYEVIKDTVVMDPVSYMFASVTPEEYVNMLVMSVTTGQSMD